MLLPNPNKHRMNRLHSAVHGAASDGLSRARENFLDNALRQQPAGVGRQAELEAGLHPESRSSMRAHQLANLVAAAQAAGVPNGGGGIHYFGPAGAGVAHPNPLMPTQGGPARANQFIPHQDFQTHHTMLGAPTPADNLPQNGGAIGAHQLVPLGAGIYYHTGTGQLHGIPSPLPPMAGRPGLAG